jgi:hypothetical protein
MVGCSARRYCNHCSAASLGTISNILQMQDINDGEVLPILLRTKAKRLRPVRDRKFASSHLLRNANGLRASRISSMTSASSKTELRSGMVASLSKGAAFESLDLDVEATWDGAESGRRGASMGLEDEVAFLRAALSSFFFCFCSSV